MSKQADNPLYEGKAKILYPGSEAGTIRQYFKDDATAFNAQKRDIISGKGILNNLISSHLFPAIGQMGICLLYTSPSPRDQRGSRMPSSA